MADRRGEHRVRLRAIYSIHFAIDDFDGDRKADVLARQELVRLSSFLGRDGSFEWREDAADLGTLGSLLDVSFSSGSAQLPAALKG